MRFVFTCVLIIASLGVSACQTTPKSLNPKSEDESKIPKLKKPVVRRIWVPEKIEENGLVWEEGHWRYEVEKNATFAR